jgi:hypothetical protein
VGRVGGKKERGRGKGERGGVVGGLVVEFLILVVFEGCVVNWKFFFVLLGGGEERLGGVERWDNGSLGWWIGLGITVMVVRAWSHHVVGLHGLDVTMQSSWVHTGMVMA